MHTPEVPGRETLFIFQLPLHKAIQALRKKMGTAGGGRGPGRLDASQGP